MASAESRSVPLFGGAFLVELPGNSKDASNVRQIPDNQEVFLHPDTDQCFIIELMDYVNEPDDQALMTHIHELASANEDVLPKLKLTKELSLDSLNMKSCSHVYYAECEQSVAKFRETVRNTVNIHLVLFRLQKYDTDILMTFNDPVLVDPASSSHVTESTTPRWSSELFEYAAKSLSLQDASIFG